MIGLQPCIMCCVNRRFIGAEPVVRYYEIQFLECPSCRSVVRLVQKRSATNKLPRRASAGWSESPRWADTRVPVSACDLGAIVNRTSWR